MGGRLGCTKGSILEQVAEYVYRRQQQVLEQQKRQVSRRRSHGMAWAAHVAWPEQRDWFVPNEMRGTEMLRKCAGICI